MNHLLAGFSQIIISASPAQISADPTLGGRLVLEQQGAISVTYAPFEYVNQQARVVLLGITPGRQQAVNGLLEARRHLVAGQHLTSASKAAKGAASFSGSMRPKLIDMLDHIGVHRWLGLPSCAALFGAEARLVHYTSALRYPVYLNGENYSGTPDMTSHPLLRRYVSEYLAAEVRQLTDAIWIPLGPRPAAALAMLAQQCAIDSTRILDGLPHPSGANGERISYFLGRKKRSELSSKTNPAILDAARERLTRRVAGLA
ncbi:hypothetical protein [Microvirga sp. TS319]|uniref:hypothetical protein n=1 Tax=Microvirga sp. TS319 TaxID=3241165 RepID=UPI00351A5BF8